MRLLRRRYRARLQPKVLKWTGTAFLILAGVAAFWAIFPSEVRAPSGHSLGRLPRGVSPDTLSLLLITLDTTRADRLGAYGFHQIETPNLDRLAREGILFEQAVSTAPLTLPAHASIFTSKTPPAHGVRDNGGFFLDEKETTLAEHLKGQGFQTGAFVGAYVLDSRWGLDQGFDVYDDEFDLAGHEWISLSGIERRANEVADRALAWLNRVAPQRFFAWAHFYDAHSPYEPPEPYRTRYGDRRYAGEIAFVDAQVARLIHWLENRGLLNRTIVAVIGDHGESLGEHGEGTHGFFVYESALRVPFLIRSPYDAVQHRRVSDMVRQIDVMPTVLDLLGIEAPAGLSGVSLVPLMNGSRRELQLAAYSESLYPRYHFGWADLRALRAGRYKFIAAPRSELYDLQVDPHESRNLFTERRALADRMARALKALQGTTNPDLRSPASLDPDVRARLAALGYVGGFASTSASDAATLADPKDKIELFNLMISARDSGGRSDSEIAIQALRKVISADPLVIDAWLRLGNEYFARRDFQTAIRHYRRALELKPDYDLAVINLAHAYRKLGRHQEALVGYRRFLELDPHNAHVRYEAAQILIDTGRLDEAADHLRLALAAEAGMAAARNALGVVAMKRGDLSSAEQEIRTALEQQPDLRLGHFNLGVLAEARGDSLRAIEEHRHEVALYPKASYKAQFNLGQLHGKLGDRVKQLEAHRDAIAQNPSFAEGHLFLAKLLLDLGHDSNEALALADKGIQLDPRSEFAPLGHYVRADIFNRQGRRAEAARELARGQALEQRSRSRG